MTASRSAATSGDPDWLRPCSSSGRIEIVSGASPIWRTRPVSSSTAPWSATVTWTLPSGWRVGPPSTLTATATFIRSVSLAVAASSPVSSRSTNVISAALVVPPRRTSTPIGTTPSGSRSVAAAAGLAGSSTFGVVGRTTCRLPLPEGVTPHKETLTRSTADPGWSIASSAWARVVTGR